ncbi:MAG: hypothetical protein HYX72_00785 [Acidobacteria bacterium]|nr:hypothetical protein [Acidobacteriota bacterium]
MATTDSFPVDPDYTVTRSKESNVLRGRVESAREYFRQKAAPRRIFDLVFSRRSKADWDEIEQFRLQMMTDFFTFEDKTAARSYSVYFNSEPIYEEVGHEQINMRLELIEAVGVAMAVYPSFATANPFGTVPVAQATDMGANGKLFVYPGYGYRVNGSFGQIYLDEALTGGENPKTDVVLALHRVRIVGGGPVSLDYLT